MNDYEKLKQKYINKINKNLNVPVQELKPIKSKEYRQFREELKSRSVSMYEKICNILEKQIKFKPDPKSRKKLIESINAAHLNITPEGAFTTAYMIPLILMFVSIFGFVLVPYLLNEGISMFFLGVGLLVSLSLIVPLQKYPNYLATTWRMKGANQMIICVFYVVTYMRHSPNLERAIDFATEHLDPPLSLDLKKVLWNVENETYDSVKDSLEEYLKGWKEHNEEFVDAMHLIESSLLEGSESRRLSLLDKALDVILNGTYEKMLHYAQNLKNPITALHMLGIILPVLGLVILPLAVSFMGGISWIHLAVLYNIILPFVVFLMGKNILSTRPSGYGDSDISENMRGLKKYKNLIFNFLGTTIKISPKTIALTFFGILAFFAFLPFISFYSGADDFCWDFSNPELFCKDKSEEECAMTYCAWGFKETPKDGAGMETLLNKEDFSDANKLIGPYGILAGLLSVFLVIGMGLGAGLYFKLRSKNVIKVRNQTKKMEKEFSTALFQLGNRLGDGQPAERVFPQVAEIMKGTVSGRFFTQVTINMQKLGMGLSDALFDEKNGAVNYFPSKIIKSSMKVLIESVERGPKIAGEAMGNIARYIKELHRVDERLKDLLSDIISSMKQQIRFLAPVISGVVVGITSMITFIMGELQSVTGEVGEDMGQAQGMQELLSMGAGIPSFYFQIVVGIYVVEIVYILTSISNSVENGEDKLGERNQLGKNLIKSTLLYSIIALTLLLLFQIMAGEIASKSGVI